jgi:hypothetical protein
VDGFLQLNIFDSYITATIDLFVMLYQLLRSLLAQRLVDPNKYFPKQQLHIRHESWKSARSEGRF